MNFEQAFSYASGELKAEELKANSLEVTDQASEQTAASTQGGSDSGEQTEKKRCIPVGKFQFLSVLLITLGMTSGSYIILPLSYLELMPQFKCEYE